MLQAAGQPWAAVSALRPHRGGPSVDAQPLRSAQPCAGGQRRVSSLRRVRAGVAAPLAGCAAATAGGRGARRRPAGAPAAPRAAGGAADAEAGLSAVEALHAAAAADAEGGRPPAEEVLTAVLRLQRRPALERASFAEALAGGGAPGRRWRLLYVAGAGDVSKARKALQGLGSGGAAGQYVDGLVSAVQRFDAASEENENGIFGLLGLGLGRLITFKGPFKFKRSICAFQSATMCLGPLEVPLESSEGFGDKKVNQLPFFNFVHVDGLVAAAIGRSGGVALWARTSPEFERDHMKLSDT